MTWRLKPVARRPIAKGLPCAAGLALALSLAIGLVARAQTDAAPTDTGQAAPAQTRAKPNWQPKEQVNGQPKRRPREPAKPAPAVQPDPPAPAPAPSHILVPDAQGIVILVDNAIIALSHANLTGNYSVLRDLGAPDFQKINPPERLAAIFANLRARNLNLNPIVLYQPKFERQPAIDEKGFLRTTGFYETQPLQVHFALVFQPIEGSWRLFEISVWTAMTP